MILKSHSLIRLNLTGKWLSAKQEKTLKMKLGVNTAG